MGGSPFLLGKTPLVISGRFFVEGDRWRQLLLCHAPSGDLLVARAGGHGGVHHGESGCDVKEYGFFTNDMIYDNIWGVQFYKIL